MFNLMVLALVFLIYSGVCSAQNSTMLGGFVMEGTILEQSNTAKLVVTGSFNFPIVNKYRKPNSITGEPGKVLERLDWQVNVDNLPIHIKRIHCAVVEKVLIYKRSIGNCIDRPVSISIHNPSITFNEFGMVAAIDAEEAVITPIDIVDKL